MKNKNVIIFIIIFIIFIGVLTFELMFSKNKYVCLNKDVKLGDIITEKNIKKCSTKEQLSEKVIVKKDFFDFKERKEYIYIGVNKYAKEFLNYDDFSIEENKINLINKLTVEGIMCLDNDLNSEKIKYEIYINNKKVYAKNLSTGFSNLIFDEQEVRYIAQRDYCCAGDSKLLILTEKGNVYISREDIRYRESCNEYSFSFFNHNLKDIVSFKEYYIVDTMNVGKLYAIDKNGNSYLIDEEF